MDKIKKFLMEKPHTPRAVRRLEDRLVKDPAPAEPEISLDRIAGIMGKLGTSPPQKRPLKRPH